MRGLSIFNSLYRHALARVCAPATRLSTGLHLGVIFHALTALHTPLADLGVHTTSMRVEIRVSQHKVGACLTDVYTVKKKPNVNSLSVSPTLLQATGNSLNADAAAIYCVPGCLVGAAGSREHLIKHLGGKVYMQQQSQKGLKKTQSNFQKDCCKDSGGGVFLSLFAAILPTGGE